MKTPMPDFILMKKAEWDSLSEPAKQKLVALFKPKPPTEQQRQAVLRRARAAEEIRDILLGGTP